MVFSKKFVSECLEYSTYEKNVPAPLFRRSFAVEDEPKRAELLICGLGFYDVFVNGIKITKGYIAPYVSNTDHYTYFDKYDILPYLKNGENVIGVMLGDGFLVGKTKVWDFKDNIINAAPMLALTAEIEVGDRVISFEADEFKCRKGPILFNDLRSGVFYDARLELTGWNSPNFDDSDWHEPIKCSPPRGKAKICEAEPIKIRREIKPVSIKKGEMTPYCPSDQITKFISMIKPFEKGVPLCGGYIYDFGENNSGIYRLKIKGERGQKINIQCAEQLTDGKVNCSNINFYPDGFSQRDIYYLKGEGEEIFEPMFTFHGYRYIYIEGITEEQATEELLTYIVLSSDLEERGSFECSDEIANKIYDMARRSDISNFFYFPMDCPHREKNGWTGDASLSSEHMMMTIGAENSFREWLNNIRMAQTEKGAFPGIIPTDSWGYSWGNGPAWDNVICNLPYFVFKYRGDKQIIKENASAILRYLEYVTRKRNEHGIIEFGLGDWIPVGKGRVQAPLGLTGSIMILDMCRKASEMFEYANLPLHKYFCDRLGGELLPAIRKEYIDPKALLVKGDCQSSQAMAIFYGVFTEDEKPKAFNVLMDIIKRDNFSITSGCLGMRVIFHVLSSFGQTELAYNMITKPEYPSYGYLVAKGETTLPESFILYDNYYPDSKNHHFLGDVENWFMSVVGGLCFQDATHVMVAPHFIERLSYCKTSHKLPSGDIEIFWQRKNNIVELSVKTTGNVEYVLNVGNYKIEKINDERFALR